MSDALNNVRREAYKTLFQKRTYVGWAGLLLVPFLITIGARLDNNPHTAGGDQGPPFFILIRGNGIYVSLAALAMLASFLLPLLASMMGSYTIAGEAETGTLRTVLIEPVRRGRLLLAKWFVANLYTAVGLVFIGVGSMAAGGLVFGLHPLTLLTGQAVGFWHGLGLIALAYTFTLFAMACMVSLAVMISTLTDSSLTAVAVALVLFILFNVLGAFSVFDWLKPYLFTSHFDAWMNLLRKPIVWGPVRNALITFAVYIVALTGAGLFIFRRKDILS